MLHLYAAHPSRSCAAAWPDCACAWVPAHAKQDLKPIESDASNTADKRCEQGCVDGAQTISLDVAVHLLRGQNEFCLWAFACGKMCISLYISSHASNITRIVYR